LLFFAEPDDDDDEGPLEVPITKQNREPTLESSKSESTVFESKLETKLKRKIKATPVSEAPKFKLVHKPRRNPTLLENLLSSEISQERSEILQCVKYVCENNFFGIGKKL
jgi:hypothetical protein